MHISLNFLVVLAILLTTVENGAARRQRRHSLTKREFVNKPEDVVAVVGEEVRLECSTDLPHPMTWHFASSTNGYSGDIYYVQVFIDLMKPRYKIVTNRTGQYTLVIPKVDINHSGRYTCNDNEGFGGSMSAEVTVLESAPTCDVIDVIETGSRQLRCNVKSVGNLKPFLECRDKQARIDATNPLTVYLNTTTRAEGCEVCFRSADAGQRRNARCLPVKFNPVITTTLSGQATGQMPQSEPVLGFTTPTSINDRVSVIVPVVIVSLLVCAIVVVVIVILEKRRRNRNTRDMEENQQSIPTGTSDGQGQLLYSPADRSDTPTARAPLPSQSCSIESDNSDKALIS